MIKINVLISNKSWKTYIKKPDIYIVKKINKLNKKSLFFKKRNLELSLLLSDNEEIKQLNKKFRKKNKTSCIKTIKSVH